MVGENGNKINSPAGLKGANFQLTARPTLAGNDRWPVGTENGSSQQDIWKHFFKLI